MSTHAGVAPRWLADAFTTRGGHTPRLLRDVDAAVWTAGSLVAKLHDDSAQARHEQNVAKRFSTAGCRVAPPLGTQDAETGGGLSWWTYVDIEGPATACEAAPLAADCPRHCWRTTDITRTVGPTNPRGPSGRRRLACCPRALATPRP
jgi:hypothetical protein